MKRKFDLEKHTAILNRNAASINTSTPISPNKQLKRISLIDEQVPPIKSEADLHQKEFTLESNTDLSDSFVTPAIIKRVKFNPNRQQEFERKFDYNAEEWSMMTYAKIHFNIHVIKGEGFSKLTGKSHTSTLHEMIEYTNVRKYSIIIITLRFLFNRA